MGSRYPYWPVQAPDLTPVELPWDEFESRLGKHGNIITKFNQLEAGSSKYVPEHKEKRQKQIVKSKEKTPLSKLIKVSRIEENLKHINFVQGILNTITSVTDGGVVTLATTVNHSQ